MICDLSLSGLDLQTAVPCTTIGAVETTAQRVRVGEGGVDNMFVGQAEDQFVNADARQQRVFGKKPFVRGIVQFNEIREMFGRIGDLCQNASAES